MNEVEVVVTDKDRTGPGVASAKRRMKAMLSGLGKDADRDGRDIGQRLGKGLLSSLTALLKPGAIAVGTGLSAQIMGAIAAGLASGAVKVVQGFGAVLALLPAAAMAAGLALGTLKLALSGVGDALKAGLTGDTKKFEEALKGLAPPAQAVAKEIVGLKPQLDSLKNTVQGNFFGPLIGQVRPLGEIYLRQLHLILGPIAAGFGQVAAKASKFLQTPEVFRKLFFAMKDGATAVTNLQAGLVNLLAAFVPLVSVGATFLPGLTDGFGGATARLAEFMREAERTGALRDFIQRGIDAIKSLIDTGAQLVRIFKNLGRIGKSALEGLGSPAGTLLDTIERLTEKWAEFLETGEGKSGMANILQIAGGFANSFFGTLQKVGEILGPIMPQIGELLTAFFELKTAILDALAPAVVFIGEHVLPALTSLLSWLADNQPVLQGILIAIFTLWAYHAGLAAAATLAATWPFVLIGIGIAALAALFITHWGTIKRVIEGVFNWVRSNWPLILAILTGPIGMAVLMIVRHWDTIKRTAGNLINAVVGFFTALPGRIAGALGRIPNLIWTALTSAKNIVRDAVNAIIDFFWSIPRRISGLVGAILDKLPSPGGGVPFIPGIAHGGVAGAATGGVKGGLKLVGEHGPELVRMAPGSRVFGNAMSRQMVGGMAGGGVAGAAQELLGHIGRGGSYYEDFSFRGNSANMGAFNDQLMRGYHGEWRNRGAVMAYLRGVISSASARATGQGGSRSKFAMAGGGTLVVNIYVAGSIRSDRELVKLVRDELSNGGLR